MVNVTEVWYPSDVRGSSTRTEVKQAAQNVAELSTKLETTSEQLERTLASIEIAMGAFVFCCLIATGVFIVYLATKETNGS